jgi:hypothetical protein
VVPTGDFAFGGGSGGTTLTVASMAALATGIAAIYCVPKRNSWVPFVLTSTLLPATQVIVLAGLHFPIPRIMVVCAWVPLLIGSEAFRSLKRNGLGRMDKLFIAWIVASTVAYTILYRAVGALIYKLGFAITALGGYFLLRSAIRDRRTALQLIRLLGLLTFLIGVLMLIELRSGVNPLAFLGAQALDEVRNGRIRAQGPFADSIIAGTVGAVLFPLFCGIFWARHSRPYAVAGLLGSCAMIIASASSTPASGFAAGVLALCAWPLRRHMRIIRWVAVISLVCLQLIMNASVWALIARFDATGSSSGWHRYMLVNEFIHHFGDWWLIGTTENASWGVDMWDRANWYVQSGYSGGLAEFGLFVAIIAAGYKSVGIGLRRYASQGATQKIVWAMGGALFAATVSFMGIYFSEDQSIIIWFALLALIAAAADGALGPNVEKTIRKHPIQP